MRFLGWSPQTEPQVGARLWNAHPLCQNLLCAFWFNEYSNELENKATGEMAFYFNFDINYSGQDSDFGICYEFLNGNLKLPYWPQREEITRGFTLQARVFLRTDINDRGIYIQGNSPANRVKSLIVHASTRKLAYYTRANSAETYVETSSLTVPLNQWVNVGVSVSHSGEVILMMDGFTETFTISNIDPAVTGVEAAIGTAWDGYIDHLWMWDLVIPFDELRDLRAFPYILNPPVPFNFLGDALIGIATSMSVDAWASRRQQVIRRKRVMHSRHSLSWNVLPPPLPATGAIGAYITPLDYGAEIRSV